MAIVINGSGTITGVSAGGLPDGSVDSDTLATGIDATKLADGTITNSELQYINSLSSNAQTQISGATSGDGARAYKNAAQTLTTNTNTRVDLDAESWDTGGNFDSTTNYDYVVPVSGKYLICGQVGYPSFSAGDVRCKCSIYVNNAIVFGSQDHSSFAALQFSAVAGVMDLTTADSVELWCWHTRGADSWLQTGSDATWMSIIRIG